MIAMYLACGCAGIDERDLISFVVLFILLVPVMLFLCPVVSMWPPMSRDSERTLILSSGAWANQSFFCALLLIWHEPNANVLVTVAFEPI
jgi:hypothetical protein